MLDLHDMTEALLDDDGPCRAVTFQSSSWDGVAIVPEGFAQTSRTEAANDSEGLAIPKLFCAAVSLHFIELPSEDFAVRRVAIRVAAGGHAVPDSWDRDA